MLPQLEHANVTVSNPKATAAWLCDVFDWHIRWEGPGMQTGYTVHVGTDDSYVALFSYGDAKPAKDESYRTIGMLNRLRPMPGNASRPNVSLGQWGDANDQLIEYFIEQLEGSEEDLVRNKRWLREVIVEVAKAVV